MRGAGYTRVSAHAASPVSSPGGGSGRAPRRFISQRGGRFGEGRPERASPVPDDQAKPEAAHWEGVLSAQNEGKTRNADHASVALF